MLHTTRTDADIECAVTQHGRIQDTHLGPNNNTDTEQFYETVFSSHAVPTSVHGLFRTTDLTNKMCLP